MTQLQLLERSGALSEAVAGRKNTWRIKVIEAGIGSSAYYPYEVIERDLATALPIGSHVYLNHPTMDEEWSQPERDVTKIGGKVVSAPSSDPTTQSSYCEVEFSQKVNDEIIEPFHDVLGMSIYMLGESEIGTIGEYTGAVLTKFVPDVFNSVDVVTRAGAKGAILTKVSEAYKRFGQESTVEPRRAVKENKETPSMDEETFKRILAEALTAQADTIASKLAEALKPAPVDSEVPDIAAVAEAVAKSELPEEGRKRVYEAIKTPGASVDEAIATEKKYVESIEEIVQARLRESQESFGGTGNGKVEDVQFRGFKGGSK